MKLPFIILLIILSASLLSCRNDSKRITRQADYERFMQLSADDTMISQLNLNADIAFWKLRLDKNPRDVVAKISLGSLYSRRFKVSGDINDIHVSDRFLEDANTLFKFNTSSIYRSLASNSVTQHKFHKAKIYLDSALTMGDDRFITLLMQFDVAIELGDLSMAEESLNQIGDKNSFDYLIRQAKLLDHRGDLEKAIEKMEAAARKAEVSKKDIFYLWAKSNLGDMYGHANRYNDAYQSYLEVLERDPDYLYALKGIAWLAFSHDKNMDEAKRILSYLSGLHHVPDYDLMLSEIAAFENDQEKERQLVDQYLSKVSDKRYGDMYNKYIFHLLIDQKNSVEKAIELAQREVANRPTPQSYDLLSWGYFTRGDNEQALKIARAYVENRNHEPEALFHLGIIYAHAGNFKKAKYFLEQAESSSFELGPNLAKEVKTALKKIS